MWALRASGPVLPVALLAGTPHWLAPFVITGGAIVAAAAAGMLPDSVANVATIVVVHGALLATAFAWSGGGARASAIGVMLLAVAATLSAWRPIGGVAYVAVPLWLGTLAVRGRLSGLGLGPPWPWGPVAVAALAGATLALHVFTSASRTLGYGIHVDASIVLPAVAYDLGANVPSAELFFRGALLPRLWRRWSFGTALALASAGAALRYGFDPRITTTEVRVGAVVYMVLLAALNGVLYRWSGSVLPGLVSAAVFFACYRLVGMG